MTSRKGYFEAFADHTLLKHAILYAYLQRWAFKILQWGEAGSTVYFVDGFAGAGRDQRGKPGSPTIACRIAQQVRTHFEAIPARSGARLKVLAVEAVATTLATLREQLAPFDRGDPGSVQTFQGSVSDHIDAISEETGSRPTLFFLDPFGLAGLDAATYPRMLAGQHNEVFALFSDIGAARHRGVVHAEASVERQLEALRRSLTLFPELVEHQVRGLEAEAGRKRQVVGRFGPSARLAISRALGETDWEGELRSLDADDARAELILRFVRKLVASGARHVQVLPMRGQSGGHKYCLVHASKSLKGYVVMKESVSESLRRDDLSQTMRERVREDLRLPVSESIRLLEQRFGGVTARWTGKKHDDAGTVKRFLLEETPLFHFQCGQIKDELRGRGWLRKVKRVDTVMIPDSSGHEH